MSYLQISLSLLSLILLSKTHLTLSLNPGRPFISHLTATNADDVHDLLPKYGFPRGLLPDNVESYTLSPSGSFTVKLKSPCYVQISDLAYYDTEIKGNLKYGYVDDVSGIQVKKLFVWIPITSIGASEDGQSIQFHVGFVSEALPVSLFADVPKCRNKVASSSSHLQSM